MNRTRKFLLALLAAVVAIVLVDPPLRAQVSGYFWQISPATTNYNPRTIVVPAGSSYSSSTGTLTVVGGAPSGAASGDLSGTYPGPTVAKGTFTGASTASGTASFDLSGASGVFKTPTGAVTIGTGAIGISGAVTSNVGGTTSTPWTTTGVATKNGYIYTGTAPASTTGATGTNAASIFAVVGAAGGASTNTTGTGGNGEGETHTCGAGGADTSGIAALGGAGGSFLVITGAGGAGGAPAGTGACGSVIAKAGGATCGVTFQVQNTAGTANFTVADTGNVATANGATWTAGGNVVLGSVANKLNAAFLAITSQGVGDLLVADTTTTFARVAIGASGTVLTSDGTTAAWATPSSTFAGSWASEAIGTNVVNANFTGPFRTVANTGHFRNINCSAGVAGITGSTNMTVRICSTTACIAAAKICECTLGACNTAANDPLNCDCNTAFVSGTTYRVQLSSIGDCATAPQNMICNVELTQ